MFPYLMILLMGFAAGPPTPELIASDTYRDFGVDISKLNPGLPPTKNGISITTPQALEEMNKLPDESGKLWLVIFGPEAERKLLLDALPAGGRAGLLIQEYPHNSPLAGALGFRLGGSGLTVYVMEADGKVKLRQEGGDPKPVLRALGLAAGPNPAPSPPASPDWLKKLLPWLPWGLLGVVMWLFWPEKKEEKNA